MDGAAEFDMTMGDMALKRKGPNNGGRGNRTRGAGGGGQGQDRQVQLSHALSKLLRHQATSAGIPLDGEGYASLDSVLHWQRIKTLNPSMEEIRDVVAGNEKKRFGMKRKAGITDEDDQDEPGNWLIRANQGHSIKLAGDDQGALMKEEITLANGNIPETVVHGTYFAFWDAIVRSGGLKAMTRTHVHFGTGIPGDDGGDGEKKEKKKKEKVISGMRSDAEILVFVDVEKCLREEGDRFRWWISENGVVLTEGDTTTSSSGEGDEQEQKKGGLVPCRFFKEVRGRRQGVGLLWKDGEKVADLPEGVKIVMPHGKGGRGGGGGQGGGGRGGKKGRGGKRGGGGGS